MTGRSTPTGVAPDVWVVPTATYHVDELGPVVHALLARGVHATVALPATGSAGLRNAVGERCLPTRELDVTSSCLPRGVVVMNDWGAQRNWLTIARDRGIRIVAKIEGAQDFANRDTLRWKLPYSFADVVLTQGPYDTRHVRAERALEVGSVRIEELLAAGAKWDAAAVRQSVVNFNFAYGAFPWAARRWIQDVLDASRNLDEVPHVSVHPAAPVDVVEPSLVSQSPLAVDLRTSSALITRCSTAVFDMLALGKPVIYYNPHNELVWDRIDWQKPVYVARDRHDLTAAMAAVSTSDDPAAADAARDFLLRTFVSLDRQRSASERTAEAIVQALE